MKNTQYTIVSLLQEVLRVKLAAERKAGLPGGRRHGHFPPMWQF
jgi:hypothetical protein